MVCKINLKEINTLYIIKQQLEDTMEDKTVLTASNTLDKKSVKPKNWKKIELLPKGKSSEKETLYS